MMKVLTGRVYDSSEKGEGKRILITRLWPRGIKKESVYKWFKELGPSYETLRLFKDGKMEWEDFKRTYLKRFKNEDVIKNLKELKGIAAKNNVILVCSCSDKNRCHRTLLQKKLN